MERDIQFDWEEIVGAALRRRKELKLTQRRLAAMANVSLPTVVRFEKLGRDIQISSVLAILGALGMTARNVEGTLLARGGPDGPYRIAFAPLAGSAGPLRWREVDALAGVFDALGVDHAARRLAGADLVREGRASVTGLQVKPRLLREIWPDRDPVTRGGESPRP
jgi:transcriptional regulator with XRE-family HTH domain